MSPERWQQIAQLFDEVLERGPDERAAYLAEASAGDAELCREVESLLAARDSAGRFLDQSALELEARQLAAQPPTITIGQQIAHFEVLAPLGAGAMGEVFLARDTRLDRKVALKLLPLRFTQDPSRLRRFAREARAASALSHPNIITVYEIGQDGPRHYIAAEYVEGTTLRQHLKNGPLDIPTALDIATQIAAALEAAHQTGIVHRDIKPENVMVRPDGVVKVLDFGIAKLTEKGGTDSGGLPPQHSTEQGTVIGTPGYMSPEQARGLEVDARTDIFSLGVVLYEMVAGQLPFRGTTKTDMIVALLSLEPDALTVYAPETPVELEGIVAQSLAKEREARLQTIQELQGLLQALRQQLNAPQPLWEGALFWKRWRRLATTGTISARPAQQQRSRQAGWLALPALVGALFLVWYFVSRPQRQTALFANANWRSSKVVDRRVGTNGMLSKVFFSPNGKHIAYGFQDDESSRIFVKQLASEKEQSLTDGKADDSHPVWSPDGQQLAFWSSNRAGKRGL